MFLVLLEIVPGNLHRLLIFLLSSRCSRYITGSGSLRIEDPSNNEEYEYTKSSYTDDEDTWGGVLDNEHLVGKRVQS